MRAIILQIIKASKKDSLFLGTTLALIFVTIFALFIGSNALVEEQQMKIVYTAAIGRVVTILGFIVFIVFYLKRLFDNREIEVILSRPISRTNIVFSMIIGLSFLFTLLSIPMLLILVLFLKVNIVNALVWILTFIIEGLSVLSFTLFFSLLISSAVYSLLFSMILYLLCRIIGSFVVYLSFTVKGGFYQIAEFILKITSIFIPRFDLLAKTSWLLYGDYSFMELSLGCLQGLVFMGLMFFASVFDFKRKQF
jgi:ABC-type transport system involved in multi-copper enzyme maturation permease subunit